VRAENQERLGESSASKNPIIKERLAEGGLLIIKKNPEVPIIHAKVGFLGGVRAENQERLGVTTLLSNTWTSGTKNLNEQEISEIIEGCAGSLTSFGGRNSIGLSLETLSTHQDQAWSLFDQVLCEPTFPQDCVEREAQIQLEHIKNRNDHPSSVASQLFVENLFGSHPYSRDLTGTEKSLAGLNSSKVREHYQNQINSSNAVVVVVGDVDVKVTQKRVEKLVGQLPKGKHFNKKFEVDSLNEDKFIFEKSEKEQTHIIMGVPGLTFKSDERYTLQLLQGILAGQGGRLFLELRDKASLAYTVSPVNMLGIETGYFGVYIGCSPDKSEKAISMIKTELDRISGENASDDEILRAKRYLIGRSHIDMQRNGSQASAIMFDEIYGVNCEETFRFAEHVKEITSDQIRSLAEKLFKQNKVTVAVGPVKPW
jgi:zinc protease